MTPSTLIPALTTLIKLKRPGFVWGKPGIGKSDLVRQVALELDRSLIDQRAILLDPIDLRGLPLITDGQVSWSTPSFLPTAGSGILFLDELNAAPPLVQTACYQLILDRRLGDYIMPDGWAIVAAGNRQTDRAGAQRMPSALSNRFIHLTLEPDLQDWTDWAAQHNVAPELIAFLRFRPELLHKYSGEEQAFPSPRTWSFASQILEATPPGAMRDELLNGTIGDAAQSELSGFLRVFDSLPRIESIFDSPSTTTVPKEPSALFAVCAAVARRTTPRTIQAATTYLDRLPDEFTAFGIRDMTRREPDLMATTHFTSWAENNSHLFA